MVKVLFEGKAEYADYVKITYGINDGVFKMTLYKKDKADKTKMFKQDDYENIISFSINEWFTKKLLSIITEEEIQKKYGNEDGFIDFQDFCSKKKIEMHFETVYDEYYDYERYKELIEHILSNARTYLNEYSKKEILTDYDKGILQGLWFDVDSIKNQLNFDITEQYEYSSELYEELKLEELLHDLDELIKR
ncbi:MAG: hypothetical protein IKQ35_00575 [Bacilli bacterium]|nr:hypothetical protein [Bacilli bacterium]